MGGNLVSYPKGRHRLKSFENRVLRRLQYLDPRGKKVTQQSSKLIRKVYMSINIQILLW
jgi:hypothetical protein